MTNSTETLTEITAQEGTPMPYTVMNPQPASRAPGTPDSVIAPGLYPNEVAVVLDSGQDVAVYVDATPVDNNAGVAFYASARAINADGSTILHGVVQMVTEYQHLSSQAEVTQFGSSALAAGMLLAVLGEPLQTSTVDSGGVSVQVTIPPVAAAALSSISIRTMLAASTASATLTTSGVLPVPTPAPSPA